jgi:predicted ATP-grasp superfamily ATP-dependent carboligase
VAGLGDPDPAVSRVRGCHVLAALSPTPRSPDVFLEEVAAFCKRVGADAILPTDDERATRLLAEHSSDGFFAGATVAGPDARQFSLVCDKERLQETAARLGLQTPQSIVIKSEAPTNDWPPLPGIVKPLSIGPTAGAATADKSAAVATESERAEAVRALLRVGRGALVQERIDGTAWRIHFVTDGNDFAFVPGITLRTHPPRTGMSCVQYVPRTSPPQLYEVARRLVAELAYRGPGSVQFIERNAGFYLHDVNLRLPSSVALMILAGLDMPALAVQTALGLPVSFAAFSARPGVRYVWLHGERCTLVNEIRGRNLRAAAASAAEIALAVLSPSRVLVREPLAQRLRRFAGDVRSQRSARRRPAAASAEGAQ